MTKPLPFTRAGLTRAIRAAQAAGLEVIGIEPDGTVLTRERGPALVPVISGGKRLRAVTRASARANGEEVDYDDVRA